MILLNRVGVAVLAVLLVGGLAAATEITFQVDMSYQADLGNFDSGTDGVGIRGDMNGWAGADGLTDPDNDLVYSITLDLDANATYQYKFVIWPDGDSDNVIWEDAINNRVVEVGVDPLVLDPVWFNGNSPEVINYEITFRVAMDVAVAMGSFNPDEDGVIIRGGRPEIGNWGGYTPLTRQGDSMVYLTTVLFDDMEPGIQLDYKFVIDTGNDQADPVIWEELAGDPFANRNLTPSGNEPDEDEDGYLEISLGPAWFSNNEPTDLATLYAAPYVTEIPAMGGDFIWELWVHNNLNNSFQGNLWADVTIPTGITVTVATVPFTFQPNVVRWWEELTVAVPAFAPPGSYTVTAKAGVYPGFVGTSASFTGTKLAAGANNGGQFGFEGEGWTAMPVTASDLGLDVTAATPADFELSAAYPNPFNPSTAVSVALPQASGLTVAVFNVMGQQVAELASGRYAAGRHAFSFDAHGLSSGVYFIQAQVPGELNAIQKVTLMK